MRIRDAWQILKDRQKPTPAGTSVVPSTPGASSLAIVSPWQTGALSKLVYADIFGLAPHQVLTRREALTIPAVAKARQIIVGQIANLPLRAYRGDERVDPQPTFLYRTDGVVSPWHRMAWTLDDLMFYGWCLWGVRRGTNGQILSAERCPADRWRVHDGIILIDDDHVDADSVILIPGPSEGLLDMASRTLRGAVELERAWVKRAKNPIPAIELHDTDDASLDDDEIDELIQGWATARDDEDGAIAYTPARIQVNTHGSIEPTLFTEGRNFVKLDVANFFGLPSALLDASPSTASLTYSTKEGARNEVRDFSIDYWSDPIASRLSQDDVVPAGQRVRFDKSDSYTTTPSPIGPTTED